MLQKQTIARKMLLLCITVVGFSASAHASNQGYIGIKGGLLSASSNQSSDMDNTFIYGAYAGYHFNDKLTLELDYSQSTKADSNNNQNRDEYQITNYGAYLAYRHPMESTSKGMYAKAKLGVAGAEIDNKVNNLQSFDDVGIAGGLGLGWQLKSNLALETEFNMLSSDIDDKTITLGLHFQF